MQDNKEGIYGEACKKKSEPQVFCGSDARLDALYLFYKVFLFFWCDFWVILTILN